MTTLNEAKLWLEERLDTGETCPCCGRFAKRYERKLNSGIAKALIKIYGVILKKHGDIAVAQGAEIPYLHIERDVIEPSPTHVARDFSIARFWGLIEPKVTVEDGVSTKTSGVWRLTKLGWGFVENKNRVKRCAHIYNDTCHSFSGPMVNIVDCLADKFNYSELMET